MRRTLPCSALLSLLSLLLASTSLVACATDVGPGEVEVSAFIQSTFLEPGASSVRVFVASGDLDDAGDVDVSVNGEGLAYEATNGTSGPSQHVFDTTTATPAPGSSFDVTVELPGGTAELSIPMVQAATLVTPAAPAEIAPGEALEVAWSGGVAEETDWVSFRGGDDHVIGWNGGPGAAAAEPGATSVTVPADLVAAWRLELEAVDPTLAGQPIEGTLSLFRRRSVSARPEVALGHLDVLAEVASQTVVLLP